jgi:hypothetical protein
MQKINYWARENHVAPDIAFPHPLRICDLGSDAGDQPPS